MIPRVAGLVHAYVRDRIDPAFDVIESVVEARPALAAPIVVALVALFPIWCVTAQVLNSARARQ